MTTLWTNLNDLTQPGNADRLREIAAEIGYTGKEPVLHVLKRAQRLAQMKGKTIVTEEQFRYWFDQAKDNLAAQFGIAQ